MNKLIFKNQDLKSLSHLLTGINDKLLRLAIQNQHIKARIEKKKLTE